MAYTVTNNPWSSQYNVGIGTDSPVSHMHLVTGTAQTDDDGQLKIEQTNTTSGAAATNAGMNTKNYHGTSQFMQWEDNGLRIGSRRLTNSGVGDVIFTAGSDSEKMRILANGNVGLGTASPDNPLDIEYVGGDGDAGIRLIASASDTWN